MPALQVLLQNHMLDHLYVEEVSFADGNIDLALLMKQLAHRYPRMNIAGIGAGTGGFFEPAGAKFSQHAGKASFKMLNIGKDPTEQGYER
ncbi:hypothetical protein GGP41_006448 [Bipolaris sorokiniana]|uniref:Uncharacterized protein n=2 Tax=Cochliobolus sativus TaxID=45130 RepID=A0A8H5ZQU7_COCSA|nr:uncharacterized protein COCSADRAFT_160240 [Bipolaris sorokiniana ND90Pr]EMD63989.1 hypothetical protein COCSADRAFT_160240 [Bipolaris sorokiniana ND90Pr]KAF5853707.1 hypothetical protein GGP41_006448 [Bipolaris sorokiniana]